MPWLFGSDTPVQNVAFHFIQKKKILKKKRSKHWLAPLAREEARYSLSLPHTFKRDKKGDKDHLGIDGIWQGSNMKSASSQARRQKKVEGGRKTFFYIRVQAIMTREQRLLEPLRWDGRGRGNGVRGEIKVTGGARKMRVVVEKTIDTSCIIPATFNYSNIAPFSLLRTAHFLFKTFRD